MTPAEQEQFAAFMRSHIPKPPGAQYHAPLTIFTDFSAKVLGRKIHHWRDLSEADARTVMKAARG